MINLQKTIIFCILFAAVWVQSTKAFTEEEEKEIQHLEKSLNHVMKNRELIPKDGRDHFNSWGSWKGIPDHIKLRIATRYKMNLANAHLSFDSGTDKELAELAYKTLDEDVNFWIGVFEEASRNLKNHKEMAKQGQFLKYLAHNGEVRGSRNLS